MSTAIGIETFAYSKRPRNSGTPGRNFPMITPAAMQSATQTVRFFSKKLMPAGEVPPEQTERMALALRSGGVPVEVHLFPGEGHGFRSGAVQTQVLEATEAFFRKQFGL